MPAAAAYETLAENGITFDMAVQWAQFYGQEALFNPANPSAPSFSRSSLSPWTIL